MKMMLYWTSGLLCLCLAHAATELMQNPGCESLQGWRCTHSNCSLVTDAHSGHHAIKATNRLNAYNGPTQYIQATPGHSYHVSVYVKLLNDPPGDVMGQTVSASLAFQHPNGHYDYERAAFRLWTKASDGWVHLSGEFTTPGPELKSVRIYLQVSNPAVDYLMDDFSVKEVVSGDDAGYDYLTHTDDVINRIRKTNITFQVTTPSNVNRGDVLVHVVQTKKSFPFGTAIADKVYNDQAQVKYRDFIHKHFNWAVPDNCLKWRQIQRNQGDHTYKSCLDMIHKLRQHGIKVRGHTLVWSGLHVLQNWVKALSGEPLRQAIENHIRDALNVTDGLLESWDVNNENLHYQWFETQLKDPDYTVKLFALAHRRSPHLQLFLNDNHVVSSGGYTEAYMEQAKKLKAANVGLSGMGAQCHFRNEARPDPYLIKKRLDVLAQAGIPVWVSELDVYTHNESMKADFYERALRALYGHPAVEGIMFWGFWDKHHWRGKAAAIVEGDQFELTPAGHRVLDLLENQWMTDVTHVVAPSHDTFTVRGFHGDYVVHVIHKGQELSNMRKTFTVGDTPETIQLDIHW